ncbi:MAG: hypothetical protein JWM59_340 [Verrucomicrobiales bacterium]|nr:hypothetical protein [Verrucomicrobiales bacterium]
MKKRRLARMKMPNQQALMASFIAVHGSATAATVVPETLVNVDFNGDVAGRGALPVPITFDGNLDQDPVTAASVAFVDDDDSVNDIWNGWEGTDTHASLANQVLPLRDSQGNETPLTVKWRGFTFNYTNYNNGHDSGGGFTNGPNGDGFYCGAAAGPGLVTIGGLDPAKSYSIVALSAGDPATFTIGAEVQPVAGWHSTDNPSNWAVFPKMVSDGAGNVLVTVTSNGGNFGIAGLQITADGTATDTDGDGMPDFYEDGHGLSKASGADAALDADGDGLPNLQEYRKGTDPENQDTDGDGLSDSVETGTGTWAGATNTGTDPLSADTDGDGLSDGEEDFSLPAGTDPNQKDTDGDGFSDPLEISRGTNPRDAVSNPRIKAPGLLVNIDFDGTGGAGGSTDPVTFDGNLVQDDPTALSVPMEDSSPAEMDFWNGFGTPNQTNQPLLDSKNTETPFLLTWSGFDITYTNYLNGRLGNVRTNGPNGDGHLLIGAGSTRTGVVTISGMNPQRFYDVAVIGGGSDPVNFSIGADKQAVGEWSSSTNPANLAVFTNVIPNSAGVVNITVATNGSNNFGIGGVQLAEKASILDADADGIPDLYEDANGLNKNNAADAALDADGDGLSNLREYQLGTNPQAADTDDDGLTDGVESGDGIWVSTAKTGTNPLKRDSDGDGLADGEENFDLPAGSNPNVVDSDSDGFSDRVEATRGTNPKLASSSPRRTVSTTLINVDFNGDVGGAAPLPTPLTFDGNLDQPGPTTASVAIVDGDSAANDFWNGWEDTDSQSSLADQDLPLVDSHRNATPVTVRWSGFEFNYVNYTNGRDNGGGFTNGPNGDGFYGHTTSKPTVRLGGLTPGGVYPVAAIAGGDPVKFSIGDETYDIAQWHSSTNPANWVVFESAVADSEGKIMLQVASINGTTNFGIGGVQIVLPGSSTVQTFRILAITRNAANGDITLTWESAADKTYSILWSADLASFTTPVTGQSNLPGAAGTMTRTFPTPAAGAPKLFFKVTAQ